MFCPLIPVVYVSNFNRIFPISKNVIKPKFRIFWLRLVLLPMPHIYFSGNCILGKIQFVENFAEAHLSVDDILGYRSGAVLLRK